MSHSATEPLASQEPRLTSLAHGGGCGCKIAPGVLEGILKSGTPLPVPPELLVGIETSDDAAVYQISEDLAIVATTDFFMPIVDNPHDFGRIAATNAISDVYAMGGTPIFALALVGMPINTLSVETIGQILDGGAEACRAAGIPIAGGHTIDSVEPIYGLVAIGLVNPKDIKRNAEAQAGDVLIFGKPIGVGIYSAALKKGALDEAGYGRMVATTTRLNTPGPILAKMAGVHSITDVTGFGLGGHGMEMAKGADKRIEIEWDKVPVLQNARDLAQAGYITGASGRNWQGYGAGITFAREMDKIDQALLSDPQTSGGLLVACAAEVADEVLAVFAEKGFAEAAVIGRVRALEAGEKAGLTVV